MKLPHREKAHVPIEKIRDYLLAEGHPEGGSKARLLRGLGHDERTIDILIQNLLDIAYSGEVSKIVPTTFGTRYQIDGELLTPAGILIGFRTVWLLEGHEERPRFITGYPTALRDKR